MIIGIGGVSRSGKSSLAERLKNHLIEKGHSTTVFCQDNFVVPVDTIPKIHGVTDWEDPVSINWRKLKQAVKPVTSEFQIVEGIFAFHDKELTEFYDLKILMAVSKETFLQRRKKENRWGREPDWYIQHVWESHLKFGIPENKIKNLIVIQENQMDEQWSLVIQHLLKKDIPS